MRSSASSATAAWRRCTSRATCGTAHGRGEGAALPSWPRRSAPSGSCARSASRRSCSIRTSSPLIDSGEADGDTLYYVMPFVEGRRCATGCRAAAAAGRRRVRFLRDVAGRAGVRARARHRPPRHQAGQRHARRRVTRWSWISASPRRCPPQRGATRRLVTGDRSPSSARRSARRRTWRPSRRRAIRTSTTARISTPPACVAYEMLAGRPPFTGLAARGAGGAHQPRARADRRPRPAYAARAGAAGDATAREGSGATARVGRRGARRARGARDAGHRRGRRPRAQGHGTRARAGRRARRGRGRRRRVRWVRQVARRAVGARRRHSGAPPARRRQPVRQRVRDRHACRSDRRCRRLDARGALAEDQCCRSPSRRGPRARACSAPRTETRQDGRSSG